MSGLAGVPDVAFSGLVGRASRPSPNSASAPQGSPCEFALCCYFYFQERACSNGVRVIGRRGSGESSRSGAIRWVGFGQGAAMRGRVDESGARAWCRYAINARALVSARARLPARRRARRGALGFSPPRVSKRRKETKSENREGAGQPRASRTRAGSRARASSRVPSPGRREGMRAYFGSFDVALREVKRSEHTGGCRERERRRDVKISDGHRK